jgi:hypothetical protein
MPYKALLEHVKAKKQAKLKEDKLKEAIDAYCAELAKDECACKGVHTIAHEFGIPNQYCTIANRAKGHRSAAEFGEECQKVTAAEEVILVNFILESVDWGFPMTHTQIEEYANLILHN